ncbi:LysR substrate-binding domain-containing protein [Agrobacterium burrii]|uniref:LysR family transcriptional regulator n=1 Tax=Agrobacterium burrii TaxID=2815339 RepID=A0ABS3EJT2_9HYPH|nr:LysR substrate-binding domain-containing protein [Agrobacterium burrii]MBO0132241.1 LysR family transcriptional regulator [Agrobacterium burrii]
MDTSWLADLRALADTLNFSRAAEARNITQPAFGRRIRSLEDWSGTSLIDRSTHRLKITPAGEIMLSAAQDVLQRLNRAKHELEQVRASSATLTFAATHALSFTFFPSWFQGLGPSVSTVPIRLLSDNMSECEGMMADGRAQFLLCHRHPDSDIRLSHAHFRHLELASDRLVPVAARLPSGESRHSLPGSSGDPVPFLAFDDTSGMGRILAATLQNDVRVLHLKQVFSSHLAMVLKALALEGKGVAWVPESLVSTELEEGGGLSVAGGEWVVPVKIVLIRPRTRMTELAETFWSSVETASKRTTG